MGSEAAAHSILPRGWWMALVALILGAVLRLWFIHYYPGIQGDPLVYGDIAKNWLQHGTYALTTQTGAIRPTLIRLPGYPIFIAACFTLFGMEHYNAIMFAQVVIDLGGCLLLAEFTRRIWSRKAAWWTLWLSALCPFTANYTATPMTETLEIFFIILAMYALVRFLEEPRWRWALLEAFAWSYAALLRPDGALIAVALCPAMVWYGRKRWGIARMMRFAVAAGLLSVLPFIPWTVRNWSTFHVFQPLAPRSAMDPGQFTNPGFDRWSRTICADFACTWDIYWNGGNDQIDLDNLPSRAFDSHRQYEQTKHLLDDYNDIITITPALDARFAALAAEHIRAHPFRYYIGLPLTRLADMWLRPRTALLWIEVRWWQFEEHEGETIFAWAYAGLNLVYLILAAWGLKKWPPLSAAMLFYVLIRCALLATLDAPEPRYTLECFPMIFALAAVALTRRSPETSTQDET